LGNKAPPIYFLYIQHCFHSAAWSPKEHQWLMVAQALRSHHLDSSQGYFQNQPGSNCPQGEAQHN
jgi:hypothetical protein